MEEKKTILGKVVDLRMAMQKRNLKRSGSNKYSGFDYFELTDILPAFNEEAQKLGIASVFAINSENAVLELIDVDTQDGVRFSICTNIEGLEAKMGSDKMSAGMQPVQRLGSINTYLKRYLYINALELSEHDVVDSMDKNTAPAKADVEQQAIAVSEHDIALERFNSRYQALGNDVAKREALGSWLANKGLLDEKRKPKTKTIKMKNAKLLDIWTAELEAL